MGYIVMYRQKKILAVIPARGGSKRIAKKNIYPIHGKPLIWYSIETARTAPHIDKLIVSTDDEETAHIARSYGIEVPFMRPKELARDDTPDGPVFRHAMDFFDERGEVYDYVLNLRPTTPFRSAEDISLIIETAVESGYDVVRSVTRAEGDQHPFWMYKGTNGTLTPLFPDKGIDVYYQRQMLPNDFFMLNAVIDCVSRRQLKEGRSIYLADTVGYVEIPKERALDINDQHDMAIAEILIQRTA